LTIENAESFGSFHLFQTLFDLYMTYLVESRVAYLLSQSQSHSHSTSTSSSSVEMFSNNSNSGSHNIGPNTNATIPTSTSMNPTPTPTSLHHSSGTTQSIPIYNFDPLRSESSDDRFSNSDQIFTPHQFTNGRAMINNNVVKSASSSLVSDDNQMVLQGVNSSALVYPSPSYAFSLNVPDFNSSRRMATPSLFYKNA